MNLVIRSLLFFLLNICGILYIARAGITCDTAKNLTQRCLMAEVEKLYMKSVSIEGRNDRAECDASLISEQTCELCRAFNESRSCLDVLLDSCNYREIHNFLWTAKVPYLGTVASLCNFGNVISEIHGNKDCYTGITSNLRKCFNTLDMEPSCRAADKGYTCSMRMAEAYCGSLFNKSGNHKLITEVFLRVLEPMIDLQNCSDQSELYIAQVYPKFQYRWKKRTREMTSTTTESPGRSLYFGLKSLYNCSSRQDSSVSYGLILICIFLTLINQRLSQFH